MTALAVVFAFGASVGVINTQRWGGWTKAAALLIAVMVFMVIMGRLGHAPRYL